MPGIIRVQIVSIHCTRGCNNNSVLVWLPIFYFPSYFLLVIDALRAYGAGAAGRRWAARRRRRLRARQANMTR